MNKTLLFLSMAVASIALLFFFYAFGVQDRKEHEKYVVALETVDIIPQRNLSSISSRMRDSLSPFAEAVLSQCDTVYEYGEQLPKYKEDGGASILHYIFNEITPIIGRYMKEGGDMIDKIYFAVVISKEGKVIDAVVLSKVDTALKVQLEKKLLSMPEWIPGERNGEKVCMMVPIPVGCLKWE